MPPADADRRLRSLPGIGVWTSAEVRQRACGDADAVSVGDYHLPSVVGWTLAGEPADDERMLELLAPYPGQRYRATRLIGLGGRAPEPRPRAPPPRLTGPGGSAPPRRGPRLAVRDYRSF